MRCRFYHPKLPMQNLSLHFKFLSSSSEPFRMIHSAVRLHSSSALRSLLLNVVPTKLSPASLLLFYPLKLYETSLVNFLALSPPPSSRVCFSLHPWKKRQAGEVKVNLCIQWMRCLRSFFPVGERDEREKRCLSSNVFAFFTVEMMINQKEIYMRTPWQTWLCFQRSIFYLQGKELHEAFMSGGGCVEGRSAA